MNFRLKTGIVALSLVGLAACGVSEAETLPTTTSAPVTVLQTTSTTVPETTTTIAPLVTVPSPTVVQPTVDTRPVTVPVPETTPEPVYIEPTYEVPEVQYEPTGTNAFLECVKMHESRGDYTAVNPSSGAGGAYQFLQGTWNNTANYAGRSDLVGVHPSQASPSDQDFLAITLYNWQGPSPWAGSGC